MCLSTNTNREEREGGKVEQTSEMATTENALFSFRFSFCLSFYFFSIRPELSTVYTAITIRDMKQNKYEKYIQSETDE